MIIRINDIAPEGREIAFALDVSSLNARVQSVRAKEDVHNVLPPAYNFIPPINAKLRLETDGSTVIAAGSAQASYVTTCARCAEDTTKELAVDINMVLKPHIEGKAIDFEVEDVALGYYHNDEIDCSALVEEYLVLALPFTVLCAPDCKGLCSECGINLNQQSCACSEKEGKFRDERFSVLERLKIQ